jgi:pantoate--beta-alanine ligase
LKIVRNISDLHLDHAFKIGLVPTMGAFHEGHLHLMRKARAETEVVVVSLFVNPTQFAPGEDFDRYPRDEKCDAALAEATGADVLFAPSVEDIYPRRTTSVHVGGVAKKWEGAHRPGHFDGVATVVCKLFNIINPHVAYFGLKDFQQCAVIRQMVEDLNVPVKLSFEETVRESDGLAMSSRNVYLDEKLRRVAPELYRQLRLAKDQILGGVPVEQATESAKANLTMSGFEIEYLAAVDPTTLELAVDTQSPLRVIAAAKLGSVRLIDNV